mgnify:CR=1 FL=1
MDAIYIKYYKNVYNFLYKLTNDVELSEELTQETFYTAIKKINTLKNKESIRTWLYQIAKNKWKDYLKKNKRRNVDLDENNIENLVANYDLEEDIITKDNIIELFKKIHMLDIDTREIIYLKIIRNFTFKEISQILGKSEEWARTKFYRGKIKLKESLKNEK